MGPNEVRLVRLGVSVIPVRRRVSNQDSIVNLRDAGSSMEEWHDYRDDALNLHNATVKTTGNGSAPHKKRTSCRERCEMHEITDASENT